jgi:hypothetical protein
VKCAKPSPLHAPASSAKGAPLSALAGGATASSPMAMSPKIAAREPGLLLHSPARSPISGATNFS